MKKIKWEQVNPLDIILYEFVPNKTLFISIITNVTYEHICVTDISVFVGNDTTLETFEIPTEDTNNFKLIDIVDNSQINKIIENTKEKYPEYLI